MLSASRFSDGENLSTTRLDPIVRTQARKLRARLDRYYEVEYSPDCPMRIEFPKGSYVPVFRSVLPEEPKPASAAGVVSPAASVSENAASVAEKRIVPVLKARERSW